VDVRHQGTAKPGHLEDVGEGIDGRRIDLNLCEAAAARRSDKKLPDPAIAQLTRKT
jgi:hypothetical protein